MQPLIEDNALVLFQGDSITDAGRGRSGDANLGQGYANMAAAWFSMLRPEKCVRFVNRGISGNRAKDLRDRWKSDCLDLKPRWVSILVGVNDVWRRYDSGDLTPCDAFEENYRDILRRTQETLQAGLILMEPFVLPVPQDRLEWRVDLDPKIQAVRKLAREFGAIYVPLDGLFAAACMRREPEYWAPDGVHPTQAGHAFIAHAWLRAVRAL